MAAKMRVARGSAACARMIHMMTNKGLSQITQSGGRRFSGAFASDPQLSQMPTRWQWNCMMRSELVITPDAAGRS